MKLISMTDFVIQKRSELMFKELGKACCKYAQFLKQPLKLEMFVPCDEDGNVLEQPVYTTSHSDECYCKGCEEETKRCSDLQNQYQKAKEKVMFEGFEVVEYDDKTSEIISDTAPNFIIPFKRLNKKNWEQRYNCIEDLLSSIVDIELTPTAIKQIVS